jgi:hypothetical protein
MISHLELRNQKQRPQADEEYDNKILNKLKEELQ